jgi:hypothetical protein
MLALVIAVALQAAPATPSTDGDPIVIIANRLDAVRFNLSVNRLTGEMKCTVARSSRDPAIDSYMCEVARYCARTSRKTRAAIEGCIAARKKAYLDSRRLAGN